MRRAAWCVAAGLTAAACRGGEQAASTGDERRYDIGRAATPQLIAKLDIDASPRGHGLPPGRGNAEEGRAIYQQKCASCHGVNGEGTPPNPAVIGREPRNGFPFSTDYKMPRTIGNYWPYATTLFDYIRRAMPLQSPGSLTNDEVYSVTAWLLAANDIIPAASSLDSASLVAVEMPARARFVPDDRRGGRELR